MRNKKILTIVIVFIVVLCITGGVLAYLFLTTSAFKSDKEMFLEYFSQNIQMLNNMKSSGTYKQILDEETFESNTEIKVSNSRGGEISSPLNDLSMAINMQKDNANISASRIYIDYILVYNDKANINSKDPILIQKRLSDPANVEYSNSFINLAKSIAKTTKSEHLICFKLSSFKNFCFNDVYTFNQKEFEEYIKNQFS